MTINKVQTLDKWTIQDHLKDPIEIAHYVEAAFETQDVEVIKQALKDIAGSKGMTAVAGKAGLSRAGLYKALGENGNPTLTTLTDLLPALGLKLTCAVDGS